MTILIILTLFVNDKYIMRTFSPFFLVIFVLILQINTDRNLHIGTGGFGFGCGSNSPAAQVPYSFVRLGPDTSPMIKK